jgi:uncharacterized protein
MANQKRESSNSPQGGSGNFKNDREKASDAGRKGGQQSQQGSSKDPSKPQTGGTDDNPAQQTSGSGSFANDPAKARDAGRKGGQHSQGDSKK